MRPCPPLMPLRACALSHSVVSDSVASWAVEPAKLLCPWDYPGKNTRLGYISSSRGSSPPRDWAHVSCIGRWILQHWATWEDPMPLHHRALPTFLTFVKPIGHKGFAGLHWFAKPDCAHARVLSCFRCVRLCATLWTAASQAPLAVGFSRQDYRSGLPCPPPGDLPNPRI